MAKKRSGLRARQKLGKYRIDRRLATGGFADVYQARDTIEGCLVALKIPHQSLMSPDVLSTFRQEVRITAALDHPNILPLKNAEFIDDRFVIVTLLGQETLADRLQRRMARRTVVSLTEQLLESVAAAHRQRIAHCDIKPENLILFPGHRLRLTDFGIARVAQRTIVGSGSGTVGYMAPEQAMGKPSLRSDVFSTGLIIWRMTSGKLPEWPFRWPLPGLDRIRRQYHEDVISFLKRALQVDQRKRFLDAIHMLQAWRRISRRALEGRDARRRRSAQRNGRGR